MRDGPGSSVRAATPSPAKGRKPRGKAGKIGKVGNEANTGAAAAERQRRETRVSLMSMLQGGSGGGGQVTGDGDEDGDDEELEEEENDVEEEVEEEDDDEADDNLVVLGDFREWVVDTFSQAGPRHANEDRFLVVDDLDTLQTSGGTNSRYPPGVMSSGAPTCLWGVFDGHGGSGASEYIKANAAFECSHALQDLRALAESEAAAKGGASRNPTAGVPRLLRAAIAETFQRLEAGFERVSRKTRDFSGACTTIVLCTHGVVAVGNLGDCRALLCFCETDDYGTAESHREITVAHRATDPAEKARITQAGGFVLNGRVMGVLEPSRAIGDWDLKRNPKSRHAVSSKPSLNVQVVRKNDTDTGGSGGKGARSTAGRNSKRAEKKMGGARLMNAMHSSAGGADLPRDPFMVIASDGVWDFMTDDEVVECVQKSTRFGLDRSEPARRLVAQAKAKRSQDDITAVVVHFQK